MSVGFLREVWGKLYSPPRWLLPGEDIEFMFEVEATHDAVCINAHVRDIQTGEDRYARERLDGRDLRIFSFSKHTHTMVNTLGFMMELLTHNLRPKRCREHDDCREHFALAKECWEASRPSSTEPSK